MRIKSVLHLVFTLYFSVFLYNSSYAQSYKKVSLEEIKSIDFKSKKNDTIQVEMTCTFKNNAALSYKIDAFELSLFYKGSLFATGIAPEKMVLKGKEETDVTLAIQFHFSEIETKIHEMMELDSIPIQAKIQGKASLLKIAFDTEIDFKMASQKLTQLILDQFLAKDGFKLIEMKLKNMNTQLIEIDLKNQLKNILPFELFLKNVNYSIFTDKNKSTKIGKSNVELNQLILPDSSLTISSVLTLDAKNSLISGISKVLSGSLNYFMVGELLVELNKKEIKIPIKQAFTIDPLTQEIKFIYG